MYKIFFDGQVYSCRNNETVLDTLLRSKVNVSFSCRNGICHTCLLQATSGKPPAGSQKGLKESLIHKGFFLACKCRPENDLNIELPKVSDLYGRAIICDKEMLAPDICRLYLEPSTALYYHPGQFINLRRGDGLTRSYSLASIPNEDYFLEVHVKRVPEGVMSNWLIDETKPGDELDFQGPLGSSYYRNNCRDQNLLLICTGTGLAPLLGVLRDALNHGHTGQIYLYHGSTHETGLYQQDYLRNLENVHDIFHYQPCTSGCKINHLAHGRANEIAFSRHNDLINWSVYIAGNPAMTNKAEQQAIKHGVQSNHLYVDPFENGKALNGSENSDAVETTKDSDPSRNNIDPPYPPPDPEMWKALENGKLLTTILTDFYTRVFADDRLKGFFKDTTKTRAIEKQYNFLYQVFTGEKVYFGEKPRNGHNWMVISSELFDYREAIMKSCLLKHGISAHLIERWMAMEYNYKSVLVKDKPWNKIVDGVEYPVDGFGEVTLEISTLCDICENEIQAGETVSYHLRTGVVYCKECQSSQGNDKLAI